MRYSIPGDREKAMRLARDVRASADRSDDLRTRNEERKEADRIEAAALALPG